MTDLTGIRWLLFGLQLSVVGIAVMAASGGSAFGIVGMGTIFLGLPGSVIGQFGPKDLGMSADD